jgi:hypothetical protein
MGDLYIPRIGPHISLQQKADQFWKYINLSQIYEYRNWDAEHYNYVLEITVSFLGIYKWEPGIHVGFSPALHLQCRAISLGKKFHKHEILCLLFFILIIQASPCPWSKWSFYSLKSHQIWETFMKQ